MPHRHDPFGGSARRRRSACRLAPDVIPVHHTELLRTIDAVLRSRAIIYGSLPPNARDIDLLVTTEDAAAIGRRLRGEGFEAWNRAFVAFRGCSVLVVELIPAGSLGLPADELNGLFAEALPLGPLAKVTEPAAHHTLLILARRLARDSVLRPKHRDRIDRALALDPGAWRRAREHAVPWAVESALTHLQALHRRGSVGRFHLLRRLRRPRRTRVIALAGVDSALTRSHADSLRDSLDRLGFHSLVERPAAGSESGVGALASAVSLWRPIWRQLGQGKVLIYEFPLLS
jgi:hypothetical protein